VVALLEQGVEGVDEAGYSLRDVLAVDFLSKEQHVLWILLMLIVFGTLKHR
jgi:hypothetical protein